MPRKKKAVVEEVTPLDVPEEGTIVPEDDDDSIFGPEAPQPAALAPIPSPDSDLTVDEREEFVKLLNREVPLLVRAQRLARLSAYTDTKRAGVALRALIAINEVTGVSERAAGESAPMFQLPPGTTVNVGVVKLEK